MRTDVIKAELANSFFMMATQPLQAMLKILDTDIPRVQANVEVSNNNVVYQEFGNVAVISIDGVLYKKDLSGECISVIAYPQIIKAIQRADNEENIDITLLRVDTPGGHVAGADEVEEALASAKNKTVTLYENIAASGGLYVFTASDELYAIEATRLGSIGVVASYQNKAEDSDIIELTSKYAPNKRCTLGEDCKMQLQTTLDTYETMFHQKIEKNTGFNTEQIGKIFNDGGMIFAKEALEAKFIQGITTFDKLLLDLQMGVNPSSINANASAKIVDKNEGVSMDYTKEKFEALEATHAEALAVKEDEVAVVTKSLDALTVVHDETVAKLTDLQSVVKAKDEITVEVMSMASEIGVDKDTLIAMAQSSTLDDAKIALVDGSCSYGAFGGPDTNTDVNTKAEDKQDIKMRAYKAGVVITK